MESWKCLGSVGVASGLAGPGLGGGVVFAEMANGVGSGAAGMVACLDGPALGVTGVHLGACGLAACGWASALSRRAATPRGVWLSRGGCQLDACGPSGTVAGVLLVAA